MTQHVQEAGESTSGKSQKDLTRQVGASLTWGIAGQAARRGATLLSTLLLARILNVEDFGLFTVAFTVATLLMAFTDIGVSYGIVRHQGDAEPLAGTATSIAIGFSSALYVAVFAASPFIAEAFTARGQDVHPDAVALIRVLAIVAIIDGFSKVPGAGLMRDLRERTRTLAELAGFFVSFFVSITLALGGAGAWSLVWGQLCAVAVTATLILLRSPLTRWPSWNTAHAKYLLGFGLPLAGAGIVNQLILNVDYLIVNSELNLEIAGAYFIAFNISNWPVSLISFAMRRSAIAGFARLQHDPPALQRAFVSAIQLLWTITIPMAVLIGFLAEDVLATLYGKKWLVGTVALQFLAAISVIRLTYQLCTDVLAAMGRSTAVFMVQFAWFAALVPSMFWGARNYGLAGVGATQAAASLLVALPLLLWRLRSVGLQPGKLLSVVFRPVLGGCAAAIAITLVRLPFDGHAVRLLIGGIVGALVYAVVVLPGSPVLGKINALVGRS